MATLPDGTKRSFKDLPTRMEVVSKDPKLAERLPYYTHYLGIFFDGNGGAPTKEQILDIYAKVECNGLWTDKKGFGLPYAMYMVAFVIYLETSALRHSCRPNAMIHFRRNEIVLCCTRNGVKDFSEVTVDYLDAGPLKTRTERRALLAKQRYLDCQCEKCSDENEEAYEGPCLKCPDCGKAVPVREEAGNDGVKCGHCKRIVSPNIVDRYWKLRKEFKETAELHSPGIAVSLFSQDLRSLFFPSDRECMTILFNCVLKEKVTHYTGKGLFALFNTSLSVLL